MPQCIDGIAGGSALSAKFSQANAIWKRFSLIWATQDPLAKLTNVNTKNTALIPFTLSFFLSFFLTHSLTYLFNYLLTWERPWSCLLQPSPCLSLPFDASLRHKDFMATRNPASGLALAPSLLSRGACTYTFYTPLGQMNPKCLLMFIPLSPNVNIPSKGPNMFRASHVARGRQVWKAKPLTLSLHSNTLTQCLQSRGTLSKTIGSWDRGLSHEFSSCSQL